MQPPAQSPQHQLSRPSTTSGNIGSALKSFGEWMSSDNGVLLRIQVLVFATLFGMTILVFLGSCRRFSSRKSLRCLLFCSYTLTFILATYTIGCMQSAPFHNDLFVIWSACLMLVLASADSITAYSLEDNEQNIKFLFGQVLHAVFVFILIIYYTTTIFNQSDFVVLAYYILLFTISKVILRCHAFKLASRYDGLVKGSKLVADYMAYEVEGHGEFDPVTMQGYKYIVHGESSEYKHLKVSAPNYKTNARMDGKEIVTVESIWQCKVLDSNDGRLKDLCMSFALFKLLKRRFGGHKLYEAGLAKTRDFVIHGLLSLDSDFHRAYRIIELELGFLYDLLYTRYPAYYYDDRGITTMLGLGLNLINLAFCVWTIITTSTNYVPPAKSKLFYINGKIVDVILTDIIICLVMLLEVFQLIVLPLSNWWRMKYVAFYLRHTNNPFLKCIARLMLKINSIPKPLPWGRKVNKYSLLHSFAHRSVIRNLTCGFLNKESDGRAISNRIKLSAQVKVAIGRTLKASEGKLSNGQSSLNRNGVSEILGWACRLETVTHQILVWHIATTLCATEAGNDNQVVATVLSDYCAYLVAFVPELLPGCKLDTELICTAVISEARDYLSDCHQSEERRVYELMMNVKEPYDSILKMGAKLGKELIQEIEDSSERWKVLDEFWAEFILFLAPCDDPFAHAKNMTSGGEFITHLWALLTHAGILDRPQNDGGEV